MSILHKAAIEHLLYPAMEYTKGNRIREKTAVLRKSEAAPGLPDRQCAALQSLLLDCIRHVPAYRRLHLPASEILADPCGVLARSVPVLHKAQFRDHATDYLSDAFSPAERIPNCTGGSTGQPVHFFMTRDQVESYEAARWRGLSWYGITPGSRSVMVWGNPVELDANQQRRQRWREQLLKNRRILSAYDLRAEDAPQYIRFLNRYQPEYLYGYATALDALAHILAPHQDKLRVRLKAVVSTSETLSPAQAALFSRVFGCPVANEYGARDAGILAYSCPCGGLHLSAENCIIEVLDPVTFAPLPTGQSGVLAVTDLTNRIQPRLRYLLGDVGALSAASCPCGRTLPLLSAIEGREDALLVGRGGALLHGNLIGQLLRPLPFVRAFQFRQHTPRTATLSLVPMPGGAIDRSAFLPALQRMFPETAITVEQVSSIPPAASGKMRYAIREFPLSGQEVRR